MTARRRKRPLTAGVLLVVLVAGAAGFALAEGTSQTPTGSRPSGAPLISGGPTAVPTLPRSEPVTLSIPNIGLDTRLVPLEATTEGMMELPPVKRAGWYTGSVTPGESGLTVLAGYIRRSTNEPGIFKNLRRLRIGQPIVVDRADGASANYLVTRIESYEKGSFPAEEVYASGSEPELRMVTTGGALKNGDPLGNVVVFARLIRDSPKPNQK